MLTTERLCSRIIRLLHAPIRVYDVCGSQTAIYVDKGEQQDVLSCDQELQALLLKNGRTEAPILYLEAEEIIYGAVRDGDDKVYLLGPCCVGQNPAAAAKYLIRKHGMDPQKPYRVSSIPLYDFMELFLLLHEQLTGDPMEYSELLLRSFCDQRFEQAMQKQVQEVFYAFRESSAVHNPYAQELREQESIRTGSLDALYRSFEESYVGKIGTLSRDPLRHARNLAIVLITLASRSAIAGGVLPEVAYSMSDAFIQRAEALNHVGEVIALGRQAEVEFCTAVQNLSSSVGSSSLVFRCKALIVQQLHSRLSVKDLARQLAVTPDYLSHLFVREEGIKLTDYITREKVNFAKQRLAYTNDAYGTLAFSLGFSSQSHFGQAFKKWTGMTPKQYRDRYGSQFDS